MFSFPKSGRTWLAYLYAFYAVYRLKAREADSFIDQEFLAAGHVYRPAENPLLLGLLERDPSSTVPKIRFVHGFPAHPYYSLDLRLWKLPADNALLLTRDPRDVVVSYFHHTMQRGQRARAQGKPRPAEDVNLSEFLRSESFGIRVIVEYMNQVAERSAGTFRRFDILAYEDIVDAPARELMRLLQFFGACNVDEEAANRAASRASFGALQQLEIEQRAKKTPNLPKEALRFRRGHPGSYQDEFNANDIEYLEMVICNHLSPIFNRYRPNSIGEAAYLKDR